MQLTPLTTVRHAIELIFFTFHISVAVFVGVQILRKNAAYRKGFFYLYLLLTFFDVSSVLLVSKYVQSQQTANDVAVLVVRHASARQFRDHISVRFRPHLGVFRALLPDQLLHHVSGMLSRRDRLQPVHCIPGSTFVQRGRAMKYLAGYGGAGPSMKNFLDK